MIYVLDERNGKISIPPVTTCMSRNNNPYSNRKKRLWSNPILLALILASGIITLIWTVISSLNTTTIQPTVNQKKEYVNNVINKPKNNILKDMKKNALPVTTAPKAGLAGGILHNIEEYFHLQNPKTAAPVKSKEDKEWDDIKQTLSTHPDGKKFLIGWPTIPTSHKGADSRAIDAIIFLTSIGYNVDLIYWRDYAAEVDKAWDDTEDRERLLNAGVHRILGPYEHTKLSSSHTFISSYFAFMFWLWPDGPYLECIHDFVNHILSHNGNTRILSAVDDTGVAVRNLYASRGRNDISTDEVESFLLMNKRHPDLIGEDVYHPESRRYNVTLGDKDFLSMRSPVYLFHLEMYLYFMSDVTIGLNAHITKYLLDMVPGTPSRVLSYISPIQPSDSAVISFQERKKDYIFFGYNNPANKGCVDNFISNIIHLVDKDATFHIAGVVTYNVPQACDCVHNLDGTTCSSLYKNIICHGDLNDEQLESLIQSVRVAINPVMEPSGVATKTCRAMAYGTPVVVSTLDGTFNENKFTNTGARRCDMNDNSCIASSINELLNNENIWTEASHAAQEFIIDYYGNKPYAHDWLAILKILYNRKLQVLIDGDAQQDGQSMSAQNWNIAHTLTELYSDAVEVTVMGDLTPSIKGVNHASSYPDLHNPITLPEQSSGGLMMEYKYYTSPFITGYTPHIILKQKWPPDVLSYPLKYCSYKCRIIQILPWEFGSLPKKLIKPLNRYVDVLAAPSSYNRNIFFNSGYEEERTAILPAGVDCDILLPMAKQRIQTNNTPVTFIFSGGLLPRKGIDIIIQEFHNVFCTSSNQNVKLILQTSYELGYTIEDYNTFEKLIQQCASSNIKIDLQRNTWIKGSNEHKDFLKSGDVYMAPFRSEGFGLPIVEALLLGLRVIVSTGGTSADDFGNDKLIYSVPSHEVICKHEPCNKKQLCVFPPCWDTGKDGIWKCSCEDLVKEPTWFEVDREQLRFQIRKAYNDVLTSRNEKPQQDTQENEDENNPKQFCWENVSTKYKTKFTSILKTPIQRKKITNFFFIEPEKFRLKQIEQMNRMRFIGKIIFCVFSFFGICFVGFIIRVKREELVEFGLMVYDVYIPRRVKEVCSKFMFVFKDSWVVRYVLSKSGSNKKE